MIVKRVTIIHNTVPEGADAATADVLDQVEFVKDGLAELGIPCDVAPVVDGRVWEVVKPGKECAVVNLVESPAGMPHIQVAAAAVLELLGVPFTGSDSPALMLTTDKVATRALLAASGVRVAPGGHFSPERPELLEQVPPPWIVKAAREDSSVGLDGDEIVFSEPEKVIARAQHLAQRFPGQPILLEHYLPGREFNLGMIEVNGAPVVLPIAEMTFKNYPEGMPKIVDFGAKWVEGTFAWDNTERRFLEDGEEKRLAPRLEAAAVRAWELTGVSGYARVDMRLDERGRPAVLEVNANPCITDGSGWTVAAQRTGLSNGQIIRHMLDAAMRRTLGAKAEVA